MQNQGKRTKATPLSRKLVILALVGVLAVSLGMAFSRLWDYHQGSQVYSQAGDLAGLPDLSDLPLPTAAPVVPTAAPTPTPGPEETAAPEETPEPTPTPKPTPDPYAGALAAMDFNALREVNSDVLGWILIPGTSVSYPYVQADDNSYYLNRTWRKSRSGVGAIFMECRNSPDLSDFNTIIYGHRMIADMMFHCLTSYKNQSYWAAHPCVYLTDDTGTHKYEIFAAYETAITDNTYRLVFSSDKTKQKFIDGCLEKSVIDTGVVPRTWDRILTLSTCVRSNDAKNRWVVQAVLWGEEPEPPAQPSAEPPAQGGEEPVPDPEGEEVSDQLPTPEPPADQMSPETPPDDQPQEPAAQAV